MTKRIEKKKWGNSEIIDKGNDKKESQWRWIGKRKWGNNEIMGKKRWKKEMRQNSIMYVNNVC